MSFSEFIICDGCGHYRNIGEHINILKVDMSSYLLFTAGFKLKNPQMSLHLCGSCYCKVQEGECAVRQLGNSDAIRSKLAKKDAEIQKLKEEISDYKYKVSNLLLPIKEQQ